MTLRDAIERGTSELEGAFDAALDAALPNPVALIFSDLPLAYQGKRDLVFALDLLNEGENECALIAGFARDRLQADTAADIAHLEREGWYYLRTSIDPTWQFDDGAPSLPAALAYLAHVLRERTELARNNPHQSLRDGEPAAERAALLRAMRG
ncbi:MAG TPA: hypothetical protein VGP41_08855 [Candidatus Lustribacter sp.]|jgi:hypothetical protein|nr:hypothetical protein [Candidatus Lustribacter sp.]